MAHLCIKYRLNSDGSVPEFLCLHETGVGGVYGVATPGGTSAHDDMVFVGLSELGFETDTRFEVVPSQAALESYLANISDGWTDPNPANPHDPTDRVPFDPVAAAAWVWGRLDALNARDQ